MGMSWDERYSQSLQQSELMFSNEPAVALARVFNAYPQLTHCATSRPYAIDLGAGEGRHAYMLASLGYRVSAVDISRVAVEAGRRRFKAIDEGDVSTSSGFAALPDVRVSDVVTWAYGDALTWQAPEPADLVMTTFLHLPPQQFHLSVARMCSWLAPGGHIVLVGHSRLQIDRDVKGPSDPAKLWLAGEVADIVLAAECQVLAADDIERFPGQSIDTVVVARR